MATSSKKKSSTKNANSKNNKGLDLNHKISKKVKVIAILVVIILAICVGGYAGYNVITETGNYREYVSKVNELEESLNFEDTTSDIVLPTEYEGLTIVWTSSNSTFLEISGKVNQPSYEEGDQKVTLTGLVKYESVTPIYEDVKDMIYLYELTIERTITIKAKEMSLLDKIQNVLNNITFPLETYNSIGFNTSTCYEGINVSFTSDNENVLSNTGVVTTPENDTLVKVTVRVSSNEEYLEKEYEVKVLKEDFSFNKIDVNFDSVDTTSKYSDIDLNDINIHNGMVVETVGEFEVDPSEANETPSEIKLRTVRKNDTNDPAYIETKMMTNPLLLTFNYKFDDSSHTQAKSFFNIYIKSDGEYVLFEKKTIDILDSFTTYTLDLSSYSQAQVKIEFDHEWKTESFVRIDEINATCSISQSDLEGVIILPANVNKYIILPFTTKYGGSVTWKSDDVNKIKHNGEVVSGATGKVTLIATINYGAISFTETHEVTIKSESSGSSDPLEIYFIDLGTYGLSDCGECTYIRYNDIDIIVDGGDHFETTTRSITEVFESHTLDKEIDYLIVTHPDSDHIGGLPVLFENYQIDNVYKFADETFTTQKFKNLKAAYDSEPNCNVYDVYYDVFVNKTVSEIITVSDNIYLKFINTGYLTDKETNGRSVVFELYAYDTKVLMTGDADNGGSHSSLETGYMDQIDDIDILKVVHHGTENGTTSEFLNKVKPEVAIICNGNYLGNKHGHPCKGTLQRLDAYGNGIKIYAITGGGIHAEATNEYAYRGSCTLEESLIDRNGTITCVIDNNGYTFSSSLRSTIMDIRETQYWGILFN